MKAPKEKHSGLLVFILIFSLGLSGCSFRSFLQNRATTRLQSSSEIAEELKSEKERKLADYTAKTLKETGLAGTWDSLEFAYLGKKYDWLGKTLSEVVADIELKLFVPNEMSELPGGTQLDVGLSTEEQTNPCIISLTVVNPDRENSIALDDAKVIAVCLSSIADDMGIPADEGSAWVLPQGVVLGGSFQHARELYGEPDFEENESKKNSIAYLKGNKSLTLTNSGFYDDNLAAKEVGIATLRLHIELDYVVKKATDNTDFSTDISGEPYLNIAGYKLYLRTTPMREAIENLQLTEYKSNSAEETIPAHSSIPYICNMAGYGNNTLVFRLSNNSDVEIPVEDAIIYGVEVYKDTPLLDPVKSQIFKRPTPEYLNPGDSPEPLPYSVPVYGPYGIVPGDSQEELLEKAPKEATVVGFNYGDDSYEKGIFVKTDDYTYRVIVEGGPAFNLPEDEYYVTDILLVESGW